MRQSLQTNIVNDTDVQKYNEVNYVYKGSNEGQHLRSNVALHTFLLVDPYDGVAWSTCSVPCGSGLRSRFLPNDNVGQEIECNMQSCDPGRYSVFYVDVQLQIFINGTHILQVFTILVVCFNAVNIY